MVKMTEDNKTTESSAELLKEGRRHFFCREFPKSVEKLSQACRVLAAEHGEDNVILADAFYSYGEALLEMARMETPVLGNALKGTSEVIDEADDKEEVEGNNDSLNETAKEEIADKVIEALCQAPVLENGDCQETEESEKAADAEEESKVADEKETSSEKEKAEESTKTDETTEETADNEKSEGKPDEKGDETKEDEKDDETKEGEEGEDENDDEEGEEEEGEAEDVEMKEGEEEGDDVTNEDADEENEVGNLQLAWEIIEVARTLFEKKAAAAEDECQKSLLRVADCHKKLGEVMMERDDWQVAIEELRKCLAIEKDCFKSPSRRIAETYFEMGVVFDHAEKASEAAEAFQQSVTCLQEYQKFLSEKSDKSEEDDKEIKELEGLIEEIKTRISETSQKSADATDEPQSSGTSNGQGFGVTTNGFGSSKETTNGFGHSSEKSQLTKETTDISHLIRKRPKDPESADTGSPLKKVRVDSSGDSSEAKNETPAAAAEQKAEETV